MKKLILACLLCLASAGWAGERALDHDGNLYHAYATANQGMALLHLDIYAPDGTLTTLPVRGTKIVSGNLSPQVVFSNLAKRLFIVFVQEDLSSSDVVLVTYSAAEGFSSPLLLSGANPGCRAMNPVVALTNEVSLDAQNNKVWLQLMHVLWWEGGPEPDAVYMNLPVSFQFDGLASATQIRLTELLSPGLPPADLNLFPSALYQHPSMTVPTGGVNLVQVLFFNPAVAQLQLVELSYSPDQDVARDRAHFPDIGLKNAFSLPEGFAPTQAVTSVVVNSGDIGLFSTEAGGVLYALHCSNWTQPRTLPTFLPPAEVEQLLRSILSVQ